MQIVRAAAHVSRLEATKSEEREMARRLAERPDVPAAIDLSTAEKRQAEEAETEEAVPKEPELEEEVAQTVPERPADPAYREQLVKDTDPLKAAEDVGGDLGYDPAEIRTLDIEAEQKQEQLDLTEAQAERAVTPTPARMRSLSLSREPEDLPKEPPGPPPVEPKGMKRFAATGAAQTGVALAKLKGSIAERIEEENIGANMAFLRTKTVQQLARQRETKKAGGIAEKLERELAGTETRLAHLDASVTRTPDPPPDFTKIPVSATTKPITKPYRQSDFKYPPVSRVPPPAPLPPQRVVHTQAQAAAQSKAEERRVQGLKRFESEKLFREQQQLHRTRALTHQQIADAAQKKEAFRQQQSAGKPPEPVGVLALRPDRSTLLPRHVPGSARDVTMRELKQFKLRIPDAKGGFGTFGALDPKGPLPCDDGIARIAAQNYSGYGGTGHFNRNRGNAS